MTSIAGGLVRSDVVSDQEVLGDHLFNYRLATAAIAGLCHVDFLLQFHSKLRPALKVQTQAPSGGHRSVENLTSL